MRMTEIAFVSDSLMDIETEACDKYKDCDKCPYYCKGNLPFECALETVSVGLDSAVEEYKKVSRTSISRDCVRGFWTAL